MSIVRLASIVCALALFTSSAAADVLVVDASGAGEFTDPNVALAAAVSGDVVVMRAGTYVQFSDVYQVVDKSLTIIADGAVTMSTIGVATFDAAQRVVLRGLDVVAIDGASALGLSGPGQLWAEDCTFVGDDSISGFLGGPDGTPAVSLFDVGHAAFESCTLTGGMGALSFPFLSTSFPPSDGGPALSTIQASVSLHRSTLVGGVGGTNFDFGVDSNTVTAEGGAGIDGVDSLVLVAGGSVTGGTGGVNDLAAPGGDGGDGIVLTGASELRELADTTVAGGQGGLGGDGQGSSGTPRQVSGDQTVFAATSRDYTIGGPSRESGIVTLSYDGEPNDLVGIFVALAPDAIPLKSAKGTFLLGAPLFGNLLTLPIDATGSTSFDVPLPDLGFGPDDSVVLFEQAFVLGQADGKVLSGPTVHVILDDSL